MKKNNISGEGDRTSFFKLFVENDFKIVIPMLQREYAQGREAVKEVRIEFLKALYNYLDEGVPGRDLDFIYGNVSDNAFIPLDGQQRLTTLFLLHWYLSRITPDSSLRQRFDEALLDESRQHCRFTYKTRVSSGEFCDALMLHQFSILNSPILNSPSEIIADKNWFHLSWKRDPTIMSMLNMLDAIHSLFHDRADFLPKLLDLESPVITFMFMELDRYHLSDELYIKMNSRGKPLTDFENFKARYSEYIGEELRKSDRSVYRKRLLNDGSSLSLPLDKYFAERIDSAWINMIWAYRNDEDADSSLDCGQMCDYRMANLISALLSLKYIERHPQVKGETDPAFVLLVNQSGREMLSFITLRDGDALSLDSTEFLIDAMDRLAASGGKPQSSLSSDFRHCFLLHSLMEKILFSPRELNYNDRVMLYAYLGYLLKYGDDDGINQWMRVVYNLANSDNNRIDSASEVSSAIKNIHRLLDQAPSILQHLAEGKPMEGFPTWLVEEERIKASIILRDNGDKWLKEILEAERHGYFNGQIGFLLEFSGIWEFYKKENGVDWTDHADVDYFAKFVKYSKDAQAVFANSYEDRVNDAGYRFERAVLFKGDYLPSNNQHYNLLSTATSRNNVKRDFSWKRHLRLDKDEEATERRGFVKAVFDDPAFNASQPNESLKTVFAGKSTGSQWRDWLIKHPSAIDYCEQGFISFFWGIEGREGCEGILPMRSSRLSGYHCELYTWGLYCELKNAPTEPFDEIGYYEQKVNDELPYMYFYGYRVDRRNHFIDIYAETDPEKDWSLKRFRLEFTQEGSPKKSELLDRLNDILIAEGFKQSDDNTRIKYITDSSQLKSYLPHLFSQLQQLLKG
ncbi:MAG: DUF262 domain-containing protein [Bacteroides sp.]|nr:DUF262 domain-containing protein [Bacteroides sp.]MCM1388720.1 DUF262 domain-containing protein [Bacteroides sp.]